MLMVVFGAGASYDSVPNVPIRSDGPPPLAQHLFDDRPVFNAAIARFRECRPLVSRLRDLASRTDPPPPLLEDVLAEMAGQGAQNPTTRRQLMALRFYLREAIANHTSRWTTDITGLTNYGRLLERVEHWRVEKNERVALVTFNYDEMLDDALVEQLALGDFLHQPLDYVSRPDWNLCKLHGSTNWVRKVRLRRDEAGGDNALYAISNADLVTEASGPIERGPIQAIVQRYREDGIEVTIPALAIPTTGKGGFETHPSHEEAFTAGAPAVDRLLIVGWRGMESHVLEILKTIPGHYSLGIVDPNAEHVYKQLESAVIDDLGHGRTKNVGNQSVRRVKWDTFSSLARGDAIDKWLRIPLPTNPLPNTELMTWDHYERELLPLDLARTA